MKRRVVETSRCAVPNCPTWHYARGFCKKHYAQVLRHGRLMPDRERGMTRVCKVEGCGRTNTIHWYCRKHAQQLRVHGRLAPEREHVFGCVGCRVPGCKERHCAKGLCAKHYNKARWTRIAVEGKRARKRSTRKARGGSR